MLRGTSGTLCAGCAPPEFKFPEQLSVPSVKTFSVLFFIFFLYFSHLYYTLGETGTHWIFLLKCLFLLGRTVPLTLSRHVGSFINKETPRDAPDTFSRSHAIPCYTGRKIHGVLMWACVFLGDAIAYEARREQPSPSVLLISIDRYILFRSARMRKTLGSTLN